MCQVQFVSSPCRLSPKLVFRIIWLREGTILQSQDHQESLSLRGEFKQKKNVEEGRCGLWVKSGSWESSRLGRQRLLGVWEESVRRLCSRHRLSDFVPRASVSHRRLKDTSSWAPLPQPLIQNPWSGPEIFPFIRYSWSGLRNCCHRMWRDLNRKGLDSCSKVDLAEQFEGSGEGQRKEQCSSVLGGRSCLCAQPFTLAVSLACGPVYTCTGRTWDVRELSYPCKSH